MAHDEQDYVDGWQKYSEWIDNLRDDSELISNQYDDNPAFKEKLLSSQSNVERFRLLWEDNKLREHIRAIYMKQLGSNDAAFRHVKSIDESDRLRNLGNKSFKSGKFQDAIHHYTQAVRFAPYPNEVDKNNSLALALANRSAALYALTKYRLCLLDMESAFKYGYPDENKFKLMIRKVKVLHVLSVWDNDLEHIKTYLRRLAENQDTKEYIKTEIQNMFEFIGQEQPNDVDRDDMDMLDETTMKICNINKFLPQAADCVEMSYDNDKGRYLLTNKDVSYGRLLVAEEPFVCNLAWSKRFSYCYNCFCRLYSCGIGCPNCTQVLYCSENCLNNNTIVHSHECNNFMTLQDKIGVTYIIAHIMFKIQFDLNEFVVSAKRTSMKKSLDQVLSIPLSDWPDLDYKNNYPSLLSLMDHSHEFDYDAIMGYSLTAVYLMLAFKDRIAKRLPELQDEKKELVIGSIVLKHLLQLQTNLISILDQDLRSLVSVGRSLTNIEERPIGIGLYPTVSLLNHSCSPNVISIFDRNKFIVRAGKSLECGSELNYCYGPHVNRMSKKDRQQRLKEQYFFTCQCECCSKNIENKSRALLCINCSGPVIYNHDFTNVCLKCNTRDSIDTRKYLNDIEGYKAAMTMLRTSEIEPKVKIDRLKLIEKCLAKLAYRHNSLFVEIKSDLIDCAELMEDMECALKYVQEELDLCSDIYGKESYECIMTKLKYINCKWQSLYLECEGTSSSQTKAEAKEELKNLTTYIADTRTELRDLLSSTNILGAESSYETELNFLNDIQTSIQKYLS